MVARAFEIANGTELDREDPSAPWSDGSLVSGASWASEASTAAAMSSVPAVPD